MTRKPLSRRLRFEVFKRDSFTCQYCGKKAPEVVLNCDHIDPVARGGTDDILNLITACEACNGGKAAVPLTELAAVNKKRKQLEALQERQDQIAMMMEWQQALANNEDAVLDEVCSVFTNRTRFEINASGRATLATLIRRFGFEEVLQAIRISTDQYLRWQDDAPTPESVEFAFGKIGGILTVRKQQAKHPWMEDLNRLSYMLRRRYNLMHMKQPRALVAKALQLGIEADRLRALAEESRNWTIWRTKTEALIQATEYSLDCLL